MTLNIIENYLTKNRCYQSNVKRTPIGIQLHTIGTGQGTAQAVADYWNQPGVSACVTYIVDCDMPGRVLKCLPEDVRTWADAGYGNNNLITFEICESDYIRYTAGASYTVLDFERFESDIRRGYNTAVLLCADICKRYNWDPAAKLSSGLYLISSHDEGRRAGLSSAHVDPTHIWDRFALSMDGFRQAVKKAMAESTGNTGYTVRYYRVRKNWEDAGTQLGAYVILDNAKTNCPPGYTVYDWEGKMVYSNTAVSDGTQATEFAGLSETAAAAWILEICSPIAREYALLPSVCTAQTILESGYGTTELSIRANNVCGMKCILSGNTWEGSTWDGKEKVNIRTPEQDKNGDIYYIYADFRKYVDIEDSIRDRCAYLLGARTGSGLRYEGITDTLDYRSQSELIKEGGYATDINYTSKLCNIIERFQLDKYDVLYDKDETVSRKTRQQIIELACDWAVAIADDDTHGYNNSGKGWGPEYNCIGLVMSAFNQAGLILGKASIMKMPERLLSKGFKECTDRTDLKSGSGLERGDVLWMLDDTGNHGHTELYLGNRRMVGARSDKDKKEGDSSGNEISVMKYTDLGWQRVFRLFDAYTEEIKEEEEMKDKNGETGETVEDKQEETGEAVGSPGETSEKEQAKQSEKTYRVQAGVFGKKKNANTLIAKLKRKGFAAILKKENGNYIVQLGIFTNEANARNLAAAVQKKGFQSYVKELPFENQI